MSLFRTHTPKSFNQSKVLMSYSVAICCFYTNTNKYMLKLYVRLVIVIIRSFPRSSLLTGFVSELTQRVPHVEHELFTLRSTWVHPSFSGIHVAGPFVSVWCFVGHCLSLWSLSWQLFVQMRLLDAPLVYSNFSQERVCLCLTPAIAKIPPVLFSNHKY